jgi:hypothetical protein
MLEIQRFLRDPHTEISELKAEPYKLKISAGFGGDLVGFKYNHVKSDMSLDIVQEARGLILDRTQNWRVVSYPFRKFFNAGQSEAVDIDWGSATAYEKMDGTCCPMYFYGGSWHVHTLGTVEADGPIQLDARASQRFSEWDGKTYADLFWHAFRQNYGTTDHLNRNLVYVFELCTPVNRVVTKYENFRLPLIGARRRSDLQELEVESDRFGWADRPEVFDFTDLDEVKRFCQQLPPDEEGVVIRDNRFRRIKVKADSYWRRHRMKSGAVSRKHGIIELVQEGVDDDFVGAFPDFEPLVDDVHSEINRLEQDLNQLFLDLRGPDVDPGDAEDRKRFALELKDRCSDGSVMGIMFKMLDGRIDTAHEGIMNMDADDLAQHLDLS